MSTNTHNEPDFTPEKVGEERRLCLHLTQRSCDVALGVPYNIASYALLAHIASRISGIPLGDFGHTLIDAHLYTSKPDGTLAEYDHLPGIREQMRRPSRIVPLLLIHPSIQSLADIEALMAPDVTTEHILDMFKLVDYFPHPNIPFKVAV
jgi:thymidylate synthase